MFLSRCNQSVRSFFTLFSPPLGSRVTTQLATMSSMVRKKLPILPVPPLEQTLEKLKVSATPFALSPEEFHEFCALIDDFGKPHNVGPKLHSLLSLKAQNTSNWLSHDWWVSKAYLEGRDSVMIWSNPAMVFPPIDVPEGRENVIRYIGNLILGCLDFKEFVKKGGNPDDVKGKGSQLCQDQYGKIFGTLRIPGVPSDSIVYGQLNDPDTTVVVARNNIFYEISLPPQSLEEQKQIIYGSLKQIMESNQTDVKIGCLTALVSD